MSSEPLDLLLIGCGLRGTGLLTANPELFNYRTAVVEAADRLGPGSFAEYSIDSNSAGSDFFGWVDPRGCFGEALTHPDVKTLRAIKGNFSLSLLGRALTHFGAAIARCLPPERLFLRDRVLRLDMHEALCTATLASGRRLVARNAVLATGIRETFRKELTPWESKVVLSSQIVKDSARTILRRSLPAPIAIVGGSHSGYSVAVILREIFAAAPELGCDITLIQRAPVKLFYSDWNEFRQSDRCPYETIPDPQRDVCPETGNLFRYSGLRHASKELFRSASRKQIPWLRQIQARELAEAAPWLERAALIVQAMGYESNTVPLFQHGQQFWSGQDRGVVQPGADGCILSGGGNLFAMGMDPYPYCDNSLTPTGQYALRGRQILSRLDPSPKL